MDTQSETQDKNIICHFCTIIVPQLEAYRFPKADRQKKYANNYEAYLCKDCDDYNEED